MSLYLGENLISGQATLVGKSRNIGQIIPSAIPLTDAGLHLLDGSLIQGSGIYSAFVDYIASIYDATANYFCTEAEWQASVTQYGVCGKFVYDSVNNTVRLPKITGIVEGTTDVTALGDLVEAGLPNIDGTFSVSRGDTYHYLVDNLSGAFMQGANINGVSEYGSSAATGRTITTFDASNSSSIYGNSTTVQPQTIKTLYYIVIATSTKTDIEVDIDEVATDLNGKADVDLTNTSPSSSFATAMNTAGIRTIVETYQNGNSMYRVWSDGWCEQVGYSVSTGTIQFLKVFASPPYVTFGGYTSTLPYISSSGNATQMTVAGGGYFYWKACGYLATT